LRGVNTGLSNSEKKHLKRIQDVSRLFRDLKGITAALTHYDADGLMAGASILRYLARNEIPFIVRAVHGLTDDILRDFFDLEADNYIILDLGSDLEYIYEYWKEKEDRSELIIIDHHRIHDKSDYIDYISLVNPEIYGLDGGANSSSAISTSLITYYAEGEEDPYQLEIGVIGGIGDMQLYNSATSVTPFNKFFIDLAQKRGVIRYIHDFIFFLNTKIPLYKALTWRLIPYIPNFSGRDDVGLNILEKAGVPIEREGKYITAADLSDAEKENILNTILEYISSLGVEVTSDELLGESYELLLEEHEELYYADSFSTLISALGRMDKEDMGMLLGSGVRGTLIDDALRVLEKRRKLLAEYLERASKTVEIYHDTVAIIDFRETDFNPKFAGSISTILSKSIVYQDKVIIVLCEIEEGKIKLSARAPKEKVAEGLDLSEIMRRLAEKIGGRGGGHKVAAGATLNQGEGLKSLIISEIIGYTAK
jgi:RecJ-like exonuclease